MGTTKGENRRERPGGAAGEPGLWGGGTQRKLMSNFAHLMILPGNDGVYSLNLIGAGTVFLIWVMIFEPFQKLE